jgi:hypothetical protein
LEERIALTPASFLVQGFPSPILAGTPGRFTVTAVTKEGVRDDTYNGTVTFSSNDPTAQLPLPSTLEGGAGNFAATFPGSGVKSLTVTDPQIPATGAQTGIQVNPVLQPVGVAFVAVLGVPAPADGVVARFTSLFPDPPAAYKASIDWGDTTVTAGVVAPDGAGGFLVLGTHPYKVETNFAVDVTVTAPDRNTTEVAHGGAAVLSAVEAALLLNFGFDRNRPGDPNLAASSTGLAAELKQPLPVPDTVTLFVATYLANPTGVPSDGLVFYDIRVTGTDGRAVLTASFAYPAAFTGRGELLFLDAVAHAFLPVAGSTQAADSLVVSQTVPVITVILDGTSVPRPADLTQTVFTIHVVATPSTVTVPVSAPVAVGGPTSVAGSAGKLDPPSRVTATDVGAPLGSLTTASFSRGNQVTLTLVPLQQSEVRTSQSVLAPGIDRAGSDRLYGLPDPNWIRLLWALVRLLVGHDWSEVAILFQKWTQTAAVSGR